MKISTLFASGLSLLCVVFLCSCGGNNQAPPPATKKPTVNRTASSPPPAAPRDPYLAMASYAAYNFDLRRVLAGMETRKVASGQDLERYLNSYEGPNNLDLNNDGYTDYLRVRGYRANQITRGFSITSELQPGLVQNVATVFITPHDDGWAKVRIRGDEYLYGRTPSGNRVSYSTNYVWSGLRAWLTRDDYYTSSYGYNRYPKTYKRNKIIPRDAYSRKSQTMTKTINITRETRPVAYKNKAPGVGKKAESGIKRSLKSPTRTQKAFKKREPDKSAPTGGFGKKATTGTAKSGTIPKTVSSSQKTSGTTSSPVKSGGFGKKSTASTTGTTNSSSKKVSSGGFGKKKTTSTTTGTSTSSSSTKKVSSGGFGKKKTTSSTSSSSRSSSSSKKKSSSSSTTKKKY